MEYFLADIVTLRTGLRPVVIIDCGGKMPDLQERLFALDLLKYFLLVNSVLVLLTATVSNFIDLFVILSQIIISCRTCLFFVCVLV